MKPPLTIYLHRLGPPVPAFVLAVLLVASLVLYISTAEADPSECKGNSPKKVCARVEPIEGSTVLGTVTASASFRDASLVSSVQFLVDDALLGPLDTSPPFEVPWDTTKVSNGQHKLAAVAFELSGDKSVSINAVTVNNPVPDTTAPTVAITDPAVGATVSGQVGVGAAANDNVAVIGVKFKLDGADLADDNSAPYAYTWDTTKFANGDHSLTAVARDAAGNTAVSNRSLKVSNSSSSSSSTPTATSTPTSTPTPTPPASDTAPPSVQVTSPANGAKVVDKLTISANATDNVGVKGVTFRLDGAAMAAEDTTAPYTLPWDSTFSTDGSHTISAVARDAAGNTANASATVTVENAPAPPPAVLNEPPPIAGKGYSRVFHDAFDALDMGPSNTWSNGLWYESPKPTAQDVYTQNGILNLVSRKAAGNPDVSISTLHHDGVGGRSFRFGYFEARMRWSHVAGAWPAFWLLSKANRYGQNTTSLLASEFDIFEGWSQYLGPREFTGALHRNTSSLYGVSDQVQACFADVADMSTGFHTYAGLWTGTEVVWYFDGAELCRKPVWDSTNQEMFLILDIWREREVASPPGDLRLEVDYVDVWQKP